MGNGFVHPFAGNFRGIPLLPGNLDNLLSGFYQAFWYVVFGNGFARFLDDVARIFRNIR